MKLKKAELCVLMFTLLFLAVSIGYQAGKSRTPAAFSVRTAVEAAEQSADADGQTRKSTDASASAAAPAEKVNINTADAKELCALNGIGETLAGRIIEYREVHGAFSRIEDITKVSGIGSSTLERLQDRITVD